MSKRLEGKTAIITGAGSGMGAAMARQFCDQGAKVIAADFSGQQEKIAAEIGDCCVPVQVDVSKSQDIQSMIQEAVSHFGRLDILCNNAGTQGQIADTADYDENEWDRIINVNLKGVFLGMKYAIPEMLKSGGGSIINTSSMAAIVAFPMMPAYCASKGGVYSLTRTAAAEYAARGIRVNAILPGAIDSKMTEELPEDCLDAAINGTLMGRIGTPQEIANLAVFLASNESSFITGTATPVDGGYTLV